MERLIVVSADSHVGLPPQKYRDYLDSKYHRPFDEQMKILDSAIRGAMDSLNAREGYEDWSNRQMADISTAAWDASVREKVLDEEGISAEIVYSDGLPNLSPPFQAGLSFPLDSAHPELQWAGANAHNRWLVEFCQTRPHRYIGVALAPLLFDVGRAVQEVRWASKNGLRAVAIPGFVKGYDHYHHKKYDAFWSVCEELNMVINFHAGTVPYGDYYGNNFLKANDSYKGSNGIHMAEVIFWALRPLTFLIWGGVFERFPKLRVSVTEIPVTSILIGFTAMLSFPYEVARQAELTIKGQASHLSMSPVEYFQRNVALCGTNLASCGQYEETSLGISTNQLMWGSDFPHPEGSWPRTKAWLSGSIMGLSDTAAAGVLGENAIKFYGLDRNKLEETASKIGPQINQLRAIRHG